MKMTQLKKWRPGGRAFVMAAFMLMAVASFATTGGGGLDLTGPMETTEDSIVSFLGTNAAALIGIVVTLGLFTLAVKWIRRVIKGGG